MMIKDNGELTDLHKDLVLFLWNKKEQSVYDLEKGVGRHRSHVTNKCSDLNHHKAIYSREDQFGKKFYKLNREKIRISYSTDRYAGIMVYLTACFLISIILGALIGLEFIAGAAFLGICLFFRYVFFILTEKDSKIVKICG